ncbi:MAG: preprotein translocase subunit YajC [Pseudomonadota bacterium]
MKWIRAIFLIGVAAIVAAAPAHAQNSESDSRAVAVQPYIEVSQILSAELTPGDDVLTYTQVAAGVDVSAQGRNSGLSASVRYERNIGYGDDVVDSDTISGIARGYLSVVPRALTLEAGALASRTRVDGAGGTTSNPLVRENDAEGQIYSGYIGPNINTSIGQVELTGYGRVGYTRFETDNAVFDANGDPVDVFDESVTYNANLRAGVAPGEPLPIGVGVGGGYFQEDISNLDQRVRDVYVRGDITVPVSSTLALVGGVGYEDVEISSRDALRDINGDPVIGNDGRFVTDQSTPRVLAYDVDGFIWDVGVLWQPSSRTSLAATIGRRYDSTTYYGSFSYVPNSRSQFNVAAYDGVSGFGGVLNNSLASIPTEFSAVRNSLTGDFGGCVGGDEGAVCTDALGSVRSATFRGRGVQATYQRRLGRFNASVGAGYNQREFIAAAGTVLEAADGLTDESYYVTGSLGREIGQNASLQANAYINWFDNGSLDGGGDLTAYGASAAYSRSIAGNLSARAALAVDYFDSEFSAEDFAFATALLGLRYDF